MPQYLVVNKCILRLVSINNYNYNDSILLLARSESREKQHQYAGDGVQHLRTHFICSNSKLEIPEPLHSAIPNLVLLRTISVLFSHVLGCQGQQSQKVKKCASRYGSR